jgi:hypothetical protein
MTNFFKAVLNNMLEAEKIVANGQIAFASLPNDSSQLTWFAKTVTTASAEALAKAEPIKYTVRV